jgi:hypothetical protein
MGGGTVAQANQRGYANQHQQGHIGADAACILKPLADVEADDVQHHSYQKNGERYG